MPNEKSTILPALCVPEPVKKKSKMEQTLSALKPQPMKDRTYMVAVPVERSQEDEQ